MFLALRVHPFPFRTRKLSSTVPKILSWKRLGKIGQRQLYFSLNYSRVRTATMLQKASMTEQSCPHSLFLIYSSLAQSVERMTVNHDVAGSSPAGGATPKSLENTTFSRLFLYLNTGEIAFNFALNLLLFQFFHRMIVNRKYIVKIFSFYCIVLINIQPPCYRTFVSFKAV